MSNPFKPSDGSSVHLFCGMGGDAEAFREVGFRPIFGANHNQSAVDTHAANFPDCDHWCGDVNNLDMRRVPAAQLIFASPICTEASPAGGNATPRRQLALYDPDQEGDRVPEATWDRTRATAYDLLRYAEVHGPDAVLGENVPRFSKWPLFDWWLGAWDVLNYQPFIVSGNAAHMGGPGNPIAPQDRDRIWMLFLRKGIPAPDLRLRPDAMCIECGPVQGIQHWRNPRGRKIGSYGEQYDYVCPNRACRHLRVEPVTRGVDEVIDWSLTGRRIGDGKPGKKFRPYAASTRRRVQAGIEKFGTADPFLAVLRNNADAQVITAPAPTVTAGGNHHALIIHIGRKAGPRTTAQPLSTVATRPHHALVDAATEVDNCTIRMLNPDEKKQTQRFGADYVIKGSRVEDRNMQVGNAVPVNGAHWLAARVKAVLT